MRQLHPMYDKIPIVPGDHAYNLAVAVATFAGELSPDDLAAALGADSRPDRVVEVPLASLRSLLGTLSAELGVDVAEILSAEPGGQAQAR